MYMWIFPGPSYTHWPVGRLSCLGILGMGGHNWGACNKILLFLHFLHCVGHQNLLRICDNAVGSGRRLRVGCNGMGAIAGAGRGRVLFA